MEKLADIGVFGGSGFYQFLEDIKEVNVDTPYGKPSDSLFIGKIGKHRVAFMPRHARNHSILPHQINHLSRSCQLNNPLLQNKEIYNHRMHLFAIHYLC